MYKRSSAVHDIHALVMVGGRRGDGPQSSLACALLQSGALGGCLTAAEVGGGAHQLSAWLVVEWRSPSGSALITSGQPLH